MFFNTHTTMNSFLDECIVPLLEQKENIILEQLNDLVTKGLLIVEQTHPVLVKVNNTNSTSNKLELRQSVKLVLKDKEYISSLENKVKELEGRLITIREALVDELSKNE